MSETLRERLDEFEARLDQDHDNAEATDGDYLEIWDDWRLVYEAERELERLEKVNADLLAACKDLLSAMELQQISDTANGNPGAAASCQHFIDIGRAAIAKAEATDGE